MNRLLQILVILFVLTGAEAYGQLIHRPNVGARPVGMGGAFTAISNDAHATFYNPAGLAFMKNGEVSLMHWRMPMISQVNMNYMSAYYPFGPGSVGFAWTRQAAELEEGPTNSISIMSENNMLLSYGISLTERTAVGMNISRFMVNSKLGGGAGLGFDFGALFKAATTPVLWTVGVNAKNVAANLKNESLNSIYTIGTAVQYETEDGFHSVLGSLDLQGRKNVNGIEGYSLHYASGLEYMLNFNQYRFAMRGGINGGVGYGTTVENFEFAPQGDGEFRIRSISFGGGLGYSTVLFNYAYVMMYRNTIGNSHRIGVKVRF